MVFKFIYFEKGVRIKPRFNLGDAAFYCFGRGITIVGSDGIFNQWWHRLSVHCIIHVPILKILFKGRLLRLIIPEKTTNPH